MESVYFLAKLPGSQYIPPPRPAADKNGNNLFAIKLSPPNNVDNLMYSILHIAHEK